MKISRIEKSSERWNELINYTQSCSWIVGKYLTSMMEENAFTEWESVFAIITLNR